MGRKNESSPESTPLLRHAAPSAETVAPPVEIQVAEHCQWCKTFTVSCCQTMMDVKGCRNLDEDAGSPSVALVPVAAAI